MRPLESKLKKVISEVLEISEKKVTKDLTQGSLEKWDSLGHLHLILAIEDAFGVKFKTAEIQDLGSVKIIAKKLKEHLGK